MPLADNRPGICVRRGPAARTPGPRTPVPRPRGLEYPTAIVDWLDVSTFYRLALILAGAAACVSPTAVMAADAVRAPVTQRGDISRGAM